MRKHVITTSLFFFVFCVCSYSQTTLEKFRMYKSGRVVQRSQSQTPIVTNAQTNESTSFPRYSPTTQEIWENAKSAFDSKDFKTAATLFKKLADQGDAATQYLLGVCYEDGLGVAKKRETAIYWYRKSAEQGDEDAVNALGPLYFSQGDYNNAVTWLKKAVDQGDGVVEYCLGVCYYEGRGVSVDYNLATQYFNQSAAKDNSLAKKRIEEIENARVSLSVDGNAEIYVDNTYRGRGRWEGLLLPFGSHTVECRKERHRTTTQTIDVSSKGNNVFTLTAPTPIYGTLVVKTDPAGAEVVCDGKTLGYTPLTDEKVLIGNHRITVKKRYFKDEDADIKIAEAQTLKKDFTLESRLPVEITTTPANVNLTMNGERHHTPISTFFKSGTYQVDIPRQYTTRGIQAKRTTLVLDSLNLTHNIRLKLDNNYDFATFFGVDYDMALQAVGVNFGSNLGKHFMFELNFFWGLQKTEAIHWLNMQKNASGNLSLQSYDYSHWAVDLRMGPTFWCGPFLRISPEVGAQYLKLRENAVGDASSGMVKGGYVSALGSVRFRLSFSQHIGLHVTPEYRFNVSDKKVLPELVNDVDKWVNGFGVKAGLVFFFQ